MTPDVDRQTRLGTRVGGRLSFLFKQPGKTRQTPERGLKRDAFTLGTMPWPWEIGEGSRKQAYQDFEAMDNDDGIIASCLDTIADYATTSEDRAGRAFHFESTRGVDDPQITKAIEILDRMCERTQLWLPQRARDDVRAMVKYGNWFCEIIYAIGDDELSPASWDADFTQEELHIARVKPFPFPYQVVRNDDKFARQQHGRPGSCDPGEAAWEQYDDQGNLIAQWFPYEIVHFHHGRREALPYAVPIMQPIRRHWRRLRMKEDGMAVARITRAYPKLVHSILIPYGATPEEVEETVRQYVDAVGQRKHMGVDSDGNVSTELQKTPVDVDTDFYLAAYYDQDMNVIKGDVKELQGSNPHLSDLTDIEWDVARMLARMRVPMKYLNLHLESAAPFVDSDQESPDQAFGRLILDVQHSYMAGLWQLCVIELVLHGINPMAVAQDLRIVMPSVSLVGSHLEARILNLRAQTAVMWDDLGLPESVVGRQILDMTDQEIAEWRRKREQQRNVGSTEEGETNGRGQRDRIIRQYVQPERNQDPPRSGS